MSATSREVKTFFKNVIRTIKGLDTNWEAIQKHFDDMIAGEASSQVQNSHKRMPMEEYRKLRN